MATYIFKTLGTLSLGLSDQLFLQIGPKWIPPSLKHSTPVITKRKFFPRRFTLSLLLIFSH